MRRLHCHLDFAASTLAAADSEWPFELANQAGMAQGALCQGAEARRKKNCANEVGVPLVFLVLFHLRCVCVCVCVCVSVCLSLCLSLCLSA